MGDKTAEIMDRPRSNCKNKIDVLFHIILHDLHGTLICLKTFSIQDQYLTPVVDILHQFLCSFVTVRVTDQKRGNTFFQITV